MVEGAGEDCGGTGDDAAAGVATAGAGGEGGAAVEGKGKEQLRADDLEVVIGAGAVFFADDGVACAEGRWVDPSLDAQAPRNVQTCGVWDSDNIGAAIKREGAGGEFPRDPIRARIGARNGSVIGVSGTIVGGGAGVFVQVPEGHSGEWGRESLGGGGPAVHGQRDTALRCASAGAYPNRCIPVSAISDRRRVNDRCCWCRLY